MKKKGLVLPVLISCCLLAGCGASNSTDAYEGPAYASDSATASAEESWYDYEDYAEVDVAMEAASDSTTVTFAQNKKIIYTSNVVLETKTYNDTYDRLIQLINDNGVKQAGKKKSEVLKTLMMLLQEQILLFQ